MSKEEKKKLKQTQVQKGRSIANKEVKQFSPVLLKLDNTNKQNQSKSQKINKESHALLNQNAKLQDPYQTPQRKFLERFNLQSGNLKFDSKSRKQNNSKSIQSSKQKSNDSDKYKFNQESSNYKSTEPKKGSKFNNSKQNQDSINQQSIQSSKQKSNDSEKKSSNQKYQQSIQSSKQKSYNSDNSKQNQDILNQQSIQCNKQKSNDIDKQNFNQESNQKSTEPNKSSKYNNQIQNQDIINQQSIQSKQKSNELNKNSNPKFDDSESKKQKQNEQQLNINQNYNDILSENQKSDEKFLSFSITTNKMSDISKSWKLAPSQNIISQLVTIQQMTFITIIGDYYSGKNYLFNLIANQNIENNNDTMKFYLNNLTCYSTLTLNQISNDQNAQIDINAFQHF